VAAATALVFFRSLGHGFLEWDDTRLLVDNPGFRGFGWHELRWMVSSTLLGHYVPVTWFSFALDYVFWGLRPVGYHLTNVLLHGVTAGLVCSLVTRLLDRTTAWPATTCVFGGSAAALLWGVHPLRVEAVSWVTGRRDVLSAFLFCLALSAWLRAIDRQGSSRRRWLSAAVGAYALALGAKSIVMVAPLAMIALDVHPLRRLPLDVRHWPAPAFRAVWLEKAPFVALAGLAAATTAIAVPRGIGYQLLSVREWLGKVSVSLALPAWKTIMPLALSPLYEFPRLVDFTAPRFWGSALFVVGITASVVALRRRWPGALVGWVWYMLFLVPVSLMAHAGPQVTADRYGYLPTLGLFAPLGAALAASQLRWRGRAGTWALRLTVLTLVATLATLTWTQQAIWRDTGRLWAHAVKATSDCAVCHVNLGHILLETGQPIAALGHFERAFELRPDRVGPYRSLGLALEALGRRDEAIHWFQRGLELAPGALSVRLSLASVLLAAGRPEEAIRTIDAAWRYYEPAALVPYFADAVRHRPEAPIPRFGLVRAWLAIGEKDRAQVELDVLRRLHPDLAARVALSRAS
jgi:hypothetical protein